MVTIARVAWALLLVQLALPATAWLLPTPMSTLHSSSQAKLAHRTNPPALLRAAQRSSLQRLRASSSSLAADPETAWAQHSSGDSSPLGLIASSLEVLRPASGEVVNVKEFVGNGKGFVVFMRHIGWPFCWELASNVNKMLPQFQAAGVKVMVVTVASPQKAAEFVSAQQELPLDAVFCSADLAAYRALGFYDNFGAALGARNAAIVPLEKIRSRGEQGLKSMQDSVKNFGKVSPIGLVSGRAFAIEDAKAATQLGGAFALDGGEVVFAHRDRAVADHVDLALAAAALGVA